MGIMVSSLLWVMQDLYPKPLNPKPALNITPVHGWPETPKRDPGLRALQGERGHGTAKGEDRLHLSFIGLWASRS